MLPLPPEMAIEGPRHVTVVGVGLLGGSAALALKAMDPDVTVAGVGRRRTSLDAALAAGAIDTAHLDASEAVAGSDLVLLATPVCAFADHLRTIAPVLADGAVVTDVGSTKAGVVRTAEGILGPGGPFVGSHPMAGSEHKGVTYARADLFQDATCILTPTAQTPRAVVDRIERLWRTLGMCTVRMTPEAHDRALASVSHLPHLLAGLLMMAPAEGDLAVAATGLRATTRLASGDPEMWRDILVTNREAILSALDGFGQSLASLRDLLAGGDADEIQKFLVAAKRRRDDTIGNTPAGPRESPVRKHGDPRD